MKQFAALLLLASTSSAIAEDANCPFIGTLGVKSDLNPYVQVCGNGTIESHQCGLLASENETDAEIVFDEAKFAEECDDGNTTDGDGCSSSCKAEPVRGCTDVGSANYNPAATEDDGGCYGYTQVFGCTDARALNFSPDSNLDDGSCSFSDHSTYGCTNPTANNYSSAANQDNGSCFFESGTSSNVEASYPTTDPLHLMYGCTRPSASNYNYLANQDDGSCVFLNSFSTPMYSYSASGPLDTGNPTQEDSGPNPDTQCAVDDIYNAGNHCHDHANKFQELFEGDETRIVACRGRPETEQKYHTINIYRRSQANNEWCIVEPQSGVERCFTDYSCSADDIDLLNGPGAESAKALCQGQYEYGSCRILPQGKEVTTLDNLTKGCVGAGDGSLSACMACCNSVLLDAHTSWAAWDGLGCVPNSRNDRILADYGFKCEDMCTARQEQLDMTIFDLNFGPKF